MNSAAAEKLYAIMVITRHASCPLLNASSIFYCDASSLADDGTIVKESPQEFLEGVTTGDTIYVSCKGKVPVGGSDVAERTLGMVGHHRDYSFILDNCHQFASGCLTGNFENSDNFL